LQQNKNLDMCCSLHKATMTNECNESKVKEDDSKVIITKHGFSNGSSWLADLFLLMDMSILTRGLKHMFFDQSTWLGWLIWPIYLVKSDNLNQNGQWVLVKWDILCLLHTYFLLPISHLQFYNLLTYSPTHLNVLPTYQRTHPPRCNTYLLTKPPTYLNVIPTYYPPWGLSMKS